MPAALGRNLSSPTKRSTKHNNALVVGRLPYARLPKNGDSTRPTMGGRTLLDQLQRGSNNQSLRSRNELSRVHDENTALSSIPIHDPRLRLDPKEWPRDTAAGIMAAWRELCRRQDLILREKKGLEGTKGEAEKPISGAQRTPSANSPSRKASDSTNVVPSTYTPFVWKSDALFGPPSRGSPQVTKNAKLKSVLSSHPNGWNLPSVERRSESLEQKQPERTLVLRSRSVSREPPPPTPHRSHRTNGSIASASSTVKKRQLSVSPGLKVQKKSKVNDIDERQVYPLRIVKTTSMIHTYQHQPEMTSISKERRQRGGCFSAIDEDLDEEFGPIDEDLDLTPRRPRFEKKKMNIGAISNPAENKSYSFFRPRVPPLREMEEVELYKKQIEEENLKSAKALKDLEEREVSRVAEKERALKVLAEAPKLSQLEPEHKSFETATSHGSTPYRGATRPELERRAQNFSMSTSPSNASSNTLKSGVGDSCAPSFSFNPPPSTSSTQDKYTLPAFTFNKGATATSSTSQVEKDVAAEKTEGGPESGQPQPEKIDGVESKLSNNNLIHKQPSSATPFNFPAFGQKVEDAKVLETSIPSIGTKPNDSDMDFGDAPELDSSRASTSGKTDTRTVGPPIINRVLSVTDGSKDKLPIFSFGSKSTVDNANTNSNGFSFQKPSGSPFGPNMDRHSHTSANFSFQKPPESSFNQSTPTNTMSPATATSSTGNPASLSFAGKSGTISETPSNPFIQYPSSATRGGFNSPSALPGNSANVPQAQQPTTNFSFGGPSNPSGFSFTSGVPSPSFTPTPPGEGTTAFNIGVNNTQVRNRPMAQPRSRRTARR